MVHTHTRTHTHTQTNTHTHPHTHTHHPNASRGPSVFVMVCAVRLRTHNQWSRIDCPSPHFLAWGIFDRGRTPHTHTRTRTHTHTHTHTPHPQTQLIHTQLTHTYSSTHNLLHTNPSPSLFSFLLTPCRLCLSFVACWKKLTCGVIRSFNFFQSVKTSSTYLP